MTTPNSQLTKTSNNTAFLALICLALIFVFIVTSGWHKILQPLLGLPSPFGVGLSYIIGFFIACVGVILGKAVAAERLRVLNEENPQHKYTWAAYFAVLLMISSLGTMNWLFMNAQSQNTLLRGLTDTENNLRKLELNINSFLSIPSLEEKKARIDSLRVAFENEVRNPSNCGLGQTAQARFKELQKELPNLRQLSGGTDKKCEKVNEIIAAYKESIESNYLATLDETSRKIQVKRLALLAELDTQIEELKKTNLNIEQVGNDEIRNVLKKSWALYEKSITESEQLMGKETKISPRVIVDENILGIGQITHIIAILISQWNKVQTYLIVLGAILFDVILVAFFTRHLSSNVRRNDEWSYS